MPKGNELPSEARLARSIIIGFSKQGKTHWALMAAAAGFNVLHLDGDGSKSTLARMPQEALKHIWYMDCKDSLSQPRFNRILHKMLKTGTMVWNDTLQSIHEMGDPVEATHTFWKISLSRMAPNDVVVVDGWTSYCTALVRDWADDNTIDLFDMDDSDRGMYRAIGNAASTTIGVLGCLPSHLILTAHPDEYAKVKRIVGVKTRDVKEKDQQIEWTRLIPKSTSRAHGMTLVRNFPDALWIEAMGHESFARYIDGRVQQDREGGSVFNAKKNVEEHSFANLVKALGGKAADPNQSIGGITELSGTELLADTNQKAATVKAQIAQKNSLTSLVKKVNTVAEELKI